VLKAIERKHGKDKSIEMTLLIRQAFFIDGQDIVQLSLLFSLFEEAGINYKLINKAIYDGSAMASLMADHQQAKPYHSKVARLISLITVDRYFMVTLVIGCF
jgi:predicted DsbA family dithiol-disulfide isomerase